ncbi:HAMP domain-containing sensor histidine kinase [uncultured Clostridium sp.]|uniref:sensor histidine kinase n=1 Tax=uncultured Clostridium sp. TaxID=59620 RepID=UPI0028EB4F43|nr:HAMP domain-containing sensor histidine kinase [uncultured Clostridium sp.]
MFKKLRNRFLILNMSIILMVMLAAFATIYFTTYSNVQMENQNKLNNIFALPIGISLRQDREFSSDVQGNRTVGVIPPNFSLSFNILMNGDDEVLKIVTFIDMPEETYFKAAELALNNKRDIDTIFLEGKKWMYKVSSVSSKFVTNKSGQQSIISSTGTERQIAFLDITDSDKMLTELLMTFLIIGFAMIFVIFAISLYFANRAIKPISQTWDKQKQFIADASHELKTPLAIISANSDALLAHQEETIISQKKWIDHIQAEIGRMSKLVSDLLYLAKAEDTNIKVQNMPFDMSIVANEAILSTEVLIYEKEITLTHTIESNVIVTSDSERIKQVVMILLDNAVKYTNEKGAIDITLRKTRHNIVFSVENTGKGITPSDLPKLFDRFYRISTARTQEDGGYGLGLSIAKAIIDRLGGKLYAESTVNEKTTFTFTIGL